MAKAERRARRTFYVLVDELGYPHAYRDKKEVAHDRRELSWMRDYKCLRVVELRPGERVIEAPARRGRKRKT